MKYLLCLLLLLPVAYDCQWYEESPINILNKDSNYNYTTIIATINDYARKINARILLVQVIDVVHGYCVLKANYSCGAGGDCLFSTLYTLNRKGAVIDSISYESALGDVSGLCGSVGHYSKGGYIRIVSGSGDYRTSNYDYDKIISAEYDVCTLCTFRISKKGLFVGYCIDNSYLSSTRFVNLTALNAHDLHLLRNEIFARNGQSFTDTTLRAYFTTQKWYKEIPGLNVPYQFLSDPEIIVLNRILVKEGKVPVPFPPIMLIQRIP